MSLKSIKLLSVAAATALLVSPFAAATAQTANTAPNSDTISGITFNGIVKARLYLTLSPDGNSYDSVAERIVLDTTGHVLSVTYPINGHSVRMNVELPQLLPPQ